MKREANYRLRCVQPKYAIYCPNMHYNFYVLNVAVKQATIKEEKLER
jgi:hypothetical protein